MRGCFFFLPVFSETWRKGWRESIEGQAKMMKGVENGTFEGRLKGLWWFSLTKRRQGGNLITAFKYMMLFSVTRKDSGNCLKLQQKSARAEWVQGQRKWFWAQLTSQRRSTMTFPHRGICKNEPFSLMTNNPDWRRWGMAETSSSSVGFFSPYDISTFDS